MEKNPKRMKIHIEEKNTTIPSTLYSIFDNNENSTCMTIFANEKNYPEDFSGASFMWSLRSKAVSVPAEVLPELNLMHQTSLCRSIYCGKSTKFNTLQIGTFPENKIYYTVPCSSSDPQFVLAPIPNDNITYMLFR